MTLLPSGEDYQPTGYYHWAQQGRPQEHCVGTSCDNLVAMSAGGGHAGARQAPSRARLQQPPCPVPKPQRSEPAAMAADGCGSPRGSDGAPLDQFSPMLASDPVQQLPLLPATCTSATVRVAAWLLDHTEGGGVSSGGGGMAAAAAGGEGEDASAPHHHLHHFRQASDGSGTGTAASVGDRFDNDIDGASSLGMNQDDSDEECEEGEEARRGSGDSARTASGLLPPRHLHPNPPPVMTALHAADGATTANRAPAGNPAATTSGGRQQEEDCEGYRATDYFCDARRRSLDGFMAPPVRQRNYMAALY